MRTITLAAVAAPLAALVLACGGCQSSADIAAAPAALEATAGAAASITLGLTPSSSLENGLHLDIGVGGGDRVEVLVDTGSAGIVLGEHLLGSDYTPTGETFTDFTYSSSGNTYSGEWVTAPVRLYSSSGDGSESVDTIPIRLRMVTQACSDGKPCTTDASAISVAMMGVGFDRGGAEKTIPDATVNPFLNVVGMQPGGPMTRGYVITTDQVTLGLTDEATAGFSFIPLQKLPAGQGDDWQAPTTCLSVPSADVVPQCGQLLVDTGLSYAIMQVPTGVDPPEQQGSGATATRQVLDKGQQVVVTSPDLENRVLYSFTVGDDATGAPPAVAWGHDVAIHDDEPFMNTSRYILSQLDYAYDADEGRVGFRFHAAG